MTRRLIVVVLLGVAAAYAAVLPQPREPEVPVFSEEVAASPAVSATSSVWYCAWANSGAFRDSPYLASGVAAAEVLLTLPSALPTEPPAEISATIPAAPGALAVELGEFDIRNGDAPGLVEIGRGPASVAVVVRGQNLLTGDTCVRTLTDRWYLPGGTTRDGRTTTLRLFNPLGVDAKVDIVGGSEFGVEPIAGLSDLDVPARSWFDIDLNERVPFLDDLALTVTVTSGDVVPTLVVAGASGDEASWPGTPAATTWYFPTVTQGGLAPSVMIFNPSDNPVEATIDVFGVRETQLDAIAVTVGPRVPTRVVLTDVASGVFGIRVDATAPIAAAVVAEDALPDDEVEGQPAPRFDRIAGTIGSPVTSTRWLLPGPNHLADRKSSLWLLNPTADTVTATVFPLADRSLPADKVSLDPGTVTRYTVPDGAVALGFLVEATQPIVASWTMNDNTAVAFVAGTPIETE